MFKSQGRASVTFLHLMIPVQCQAVSVHINGSSVLLCSEGNLQFCWEQVRSLKGARPREKLVIMLQHREQMLSLYSRGVIDDR